MRRALQVISIVTLSTVVRACVKVGGLTCSNHGTCIFRSCHCYEGYFGPACSKRQCPVGPAWNSIAYLIEKAHEPAECSGRGHCNYYTGQCDCNINFSGSACQIRMCPGQATGQCNGRGTCLSLGEYSRQVYGLDYSKPWDAEQIYGCHCDRGFAGYDCGLRICPAGDDPHTGKQLDEVQYIRCKTEPSLGTQVDDLTPFFIGFGGTWSAPIHYDDKISAVKKKLEAIPGLGELDVEAMNPGCDSICCGGVDLLGNLDADGFGDDTQVTKVKFLHNFGDLPPLQVHSDGRLDVDVACYSNSPQFKCEHFQFTTTFQSLAGTATPNILAHAVMGTKEDLPCSGRGICGEDTGFCDCLNGAGLFKSSDGRGHQGLLGDCGWQDQDKKLLDCDYNGEVLECKGHGVCSDTALGVVEYYCMCYDGWMGYDCSLRKCPFGKAWFGPPVFNEDHEIDGAHGQAECSNRGNCERSTGQCTCEEGLTGAACDQMMCPIDDSGIACSGHGTCHSMASLANMAIFEGMGMHHTYGAVPMSPYTWDHDQIFGCVCDDGYDGIDCMFQTCQTGDNPLTDGVPEKLMLSCTRFFNSCFREFKNAILSTTETEVFEYFETALVACDEDADCYAVVTKDDGGDVVYALQIEDTIIVVTDGTGTSIFAKQDCFVEFMFNTEHTVLLPFDATANEIEQALRHLPSLKDADVTVTMSDWAAPMCPCAPNSPTCTGTSGSNEITIEYPRANGDLPRLYAFVHNIEVTQFQVPTHKLYDMGEDCRARKGRPNLVVPLEFNMVINEDVPERASAEYLSFGLEGDISNTQLRITEDMVGAERYFLKGTFNECTQYCACHVDCVAFSRSLDALENDISPCWMKRLMPKHDRELVYREGWTTFSDFKDCCDATQFRRHIEEFGSATFCQVDEFVSNDECFSCPPGTTRDAGDDMYGLDTVCDATLCSENQYVDDFECKNCTAGSTNPAGADASGPDTICEGVECTDSAGSALNAGGDSCLLYDLFPINCDNGDTLDDDDFTAQTMCCSCKKCVLPAIENMDSDGPTCGIQVSVHLFECEFQCLSGFVPSGVTTCLNGEYDVQTCEQDTSRRLGEEDQPKRMRALGGVTKQQAAPARRLEEVVSCDPFVFADGITSGSLDGCQNGVVLEEFAQCSLNCEAGYTESDRSSLLTCLSGGGTPNADITCTENVCDPFTFFVGLDRANPDLDACTDGVVLTSSLDTGCNLACDRGFVASGNPRVHCGLKADITTDFKCDAAITNPSGIRIVSLTHQDGTFEDAICSDRGICQRDLGTCKCFEGYTSSDGRGGVGLIPDCGYFKPYQEFAAD